MSDIQPRRRSEAVNVGRTQPVGRVVLPGNDQLTWSDQRRERHAESQHAVRLYELERQGVEGVAEVARDTRIALAEVEGETFVAVAEVEGEARLDIAKVEARARVLMAEDEEEARRLSKLKWELLNARDNSRRAGDDMETRAKFAELDDDYFRRRRARGL